MNRRTLVLDPNVALAVWTRCPSFEITDYFVKNLCDSFLVFTGKMAADGVLEYMKLKGVSYRE